MARSKTLVSLRVGILLAIFSLNLLVILLSITSTLNWLYLMPVTLALAITGITHALQKKHSILRNYPVIGLFRYFFESIRPELRQYFWESDTDGTPFNRRQRSIVYQRAKNVLETVAFGMQSDPNSPGNEWVAHSVFPAKLSQKDLRVIVGNEECKHPYNLSILSISAMSYGALSKTAISALNKGAMLGNFAHNTGEGGISEYHLQGGDLIWQIGTGYFGCRNDDGTFSPDTFALNASKKEVKMIELKMSQGAKPGHGGILPAAKNTPEIAAIRHVTPGTTVASPPAHNAFSNPIEMMQFIGQLRQLSGYKPVGFKICIGDKNEFAAICDAMVTTKIYPDFITIDGSEGGTGASPLEFTDNIGMPLYESLTFVTSTLKELGIKKHIKILAAGKIITGFDILKAISLGADACYSARGMMFALGCVQALKCNEDTCPVGIATQNPKLYGGVDVADKKVRVSQFHKNTIRATLEIMEACGFQGLQDVVPSKFFRKVDPIRTMSFQDIYFSEQVKQKGDLLNKEFAN
jgi:glutamate synthase domain-containing protein 2